MYICIHTYIIYENICIRRPKSVEVGTFTLKNEEINYFPYLTQMFILLHTHTRVYVCVCILQKLCMYTSKVTQPTK